MARANTGYADVEKPNPVLPFTNAAKKKAPAITASACRSNKFID
tara:strand:- start:13018 stop:13149 length:132 start_codon:yes stop_codon:yes gene_type:complete